MSQESEQAQEAWMAHFNKRYNEHSLPCTGSAAVGMVDYRAAIKAEIEKRLETIPKDLLDKYDEQALGFYGALHFSLSLLDTVKPI